MNEEQLIDLLDRLEQGEDPAEIIAQHAGDSEAEAAILNMLEKLSGLSSRPYVSAREASRQAFLTQAASMQSDRLAPIRVAGPWLRLFRTLALATMVICLFVFGAAILAAEALPGDYLYGPKMALENARMSLTNDATAILDLSGRYQAERIAEVKELLRLGRSAEVEFEGNIDGIAGDQLTIAGVTVKTDEKSTVEGRPQVGELARVLGYTEDGQLFARSVIVLTGSILPENIEETPEPTPTLPPPNPASDQPPTETTTPTPTSTNTATPSPTPTQEPSPTATSTPAPMPTVDDDAAGGDPDDADPPDDSDDPDDPDDPGDSDDSDDSDEPDDPEKPDKPDKPEDPDEPDDD